VFHSAFLVTGLLCKLAFLGMAGVLTGQRSLSALTPEDSVGAGGLLLFADFLVPYGFAALRRSGHARWPVLGDILALAGLSFISFSKSLFIYYLVIYGIGLALAWGTRATRRELLGWKLSLLLLIAVANLGIKSQQRSGAILETDAATLAASATAGASARFMGGIYRAYVVTVREVSSGWPPLGGSYHAQVFLLPIPRVLWPDKPRVASEQLYHLLGVTEERFGTAFSVNAYGALVFDFGIRVALLGAFLLGLLLYLGDRRIPTWRALRTAPKRSLWWHGLTTAWVFQGVTLSEGGIPIALGNFALLSLAFGSAYAASWLVHQTLATASERPALDAAEEHRGAAGWRSGSLHLE
jgi:hypothetical protein